MVVPLVCEMGRSLDKTPDISNYIHGHLHSSKSLAFAWALTELKNNILHGSEAYTVCKYIQILL